MGKSLSFDDFRKTLERLTSDFQQQVRYYNSKEYDEAALRNDYLDPLWRALGWDLEKQPGKNATTPRRTA